MNNYTLLRLFYIQEHNSKNIWGNYAVASYSVSYACRKPRFGIVLYLSNCVIAYFITTCVAT